MFFWFGTQTVIKPSGGVLPENRRCSQCGSLEKMVECTSQQFFSVFSIPIVSMGTPRYALKCTRCGGLSSMP